MAFVALYDLVKIEDLFVRENLILCYFLWKK